jgi:hypothetical protein
MMMMMIKKSDEIVKNLFSNFRSTNVIKMHLPLVLVHGFTYCIKRLIEVNIFHLNQGGLFIKITISDYFIYLSWFL